MGEQLSAERIAQFKKAFAGSVSLEEVWSHIAAIEAELGGANESNRQLRSQLHELYAERDMLKSQLEAMRKSRDDLSRALEFLTNSSPASSPV